MEIKQTSFTNLFSTGSFENLSDLSDSSLRTKDGFEFKVHRVVLARENRYFRALFCGIGQSRRDFLVPGIRGEILDLVLTYIYHGTVNLNQSNVLELLVASDYLLADGLTFLVKKYTESNMSLDNCIPLYMAALEINQEDMARGCRRYIQTHFGAIVGRKTAKLEDLSFDIMKQLLDDKNINVRSEREVWSAILKWVQNDTCSRLWCVPEMIQCLKVSDMEDSLATEIFSDIVVRNPHCKDLHEIQSEGEYVSGLDILVEYHSKTFIGPPDLRSRRRPESMHLIARCQVSNNTDVVQVYLTYDENLDLWRKLGEIEFFSSYFETIDSNVYMFDAYSNRGIAFNLLDKQWREMRDITIPRVSYHVLSLKNALYVIGGESVLTGEELLDVEFYNPYQDMWFPARPMFPVTSYSAVECQGCIFVVGKLPEDIMELGMMAQVYSVESDSWTMFPPPIVFRSDFALAEYHRKLYIIGGSDVSRPLETVEVFDFHAQDRQIWQFGTDLPHAYYFPKVVVLNDKLVVFDCVWTSSLLELNPPVFWNEAEACWEPLDASLALEDLKQYLFCTIDDSERMTMILQENRDPVTQFEKCSFAKI